MRPYSALSPVNGPPTPNRTGSPPAGADCAAGAVVGAGVFTGAVVGAGVFTGAAAPAGALVAGVGVGAALPHAATATAAVVTSALSRNRRRLIITLLLGDERPHETIGGSSKVID
jgi:hypothetical protein